MATGHALIAIAESSQQLDGTIAIPTALQPLAGKKVIGDPRHE
jgi:seryl-tRNA synthetase